MAGSCWCGRSETGVCVGLHKFSDQEYAEFMAKKDELGASYKKEDFVLEKIEENKQKPKDDVPQVYPAETVIEIIEEFQDLLKDADNFPRDKAPNDYREFWSGLRGRGSRLLGLANHLIELLNKKEEK